MPVIVSCPSCRKQLRIKDELAGKRVKCPGCQSVLSIPVNDAPIPEPFPSDLLPAAPAIPPETRPDGKAKEMTQQGRVLAQRGKAELAKGAREVMAGLSSAKAGVQARFKLNALNAQLVTAFRALGREAEQAGWGGEILDAIRKQKEEIAVATAQNNKAADDAEHAKNTPGAGAAKQALSSAKSQLQLVAGVLDGLCEKLGRAVMDDATTPSGIGAEQRAEIVRLKREMADCDAIVANGKKGLRSRSMMFAAGAVAILFVLVGVFGGSTGGGGGGLFGSPKSKLMGIWRIADNDALNPLTAIYIEFDSSSGRMTTEGGFYGTEPFEGREHVFFRYTPKGDTVLLEPLSYIDSENGVKRNYDTDEVDDLALVALFTGNDKLLLLHPQTGEYSHTLVRSSAKERHAFSDTIGKIEAATPERSKREKPDYHPGGIYNPPLFKGLYSDEDAVKEYENTTKKEWEEKMEKLKKEYAEWDKENRADFERHEKWKHDSKKTMLETMRKYDSSYGTKPPLGVNKLGFNAVKTGMSYEDVVAILGSGGELSSETNIRGHSAKIYVWKKGRGGANMNVTFQNGRVVNKAQAGL